MLDENGKLTKMTLDDARTIVLAEAAAAGIEVPAGSVEDQLKEFFARMYLDIDTAIYESCVKQFNPTGSDIDIQNPGFPRLAAAKSRGFLKIDNSAGVTTVSFPENTVFTAPNGNTYTNPDAVLTLLAGETGFLSAESTEAGASQNLPADQTFEGGGGAVVTNPQPFTGGMDTETDSNYINRLTYYKSNNTSQQATVVARKELLEYYQDARLYVNTDNDGTTVPVPIPPQGLNCVILLDSGVNAGLEEIQNAINILTRRFEFGNLNNQNSDLHPIIQGSSYSGVFPQAYSISPAQAVETTVDVQITVSFPPETLPEEKLSITQSFALQFAQRMINLLSGAKGSFNFEFTPAGETVIMDTLVVEASLTGPQIAPFVSIEAVRSLISGAITTGSQGGMNLISCDNLTMEFDPGEYEQNPILLSIHAPYEGSLATVDFVMDALFSDGTSWYDRFIFLDPSKITFSVVEQV